jgi:hypothetical protein
LIHLQRESTELTNLANSGVLKAPRKAARVRFADQTQSNARASRQSGATHNQNDAPKLTAICFRYYDKIPSRPAAMQTPEMRATGNGEN